MMQIRKSKERGGGDHGWLKSQHTFSFADYYDPENMGFSALRVINEDYIAGGTGFPTHPHRDMEIITVVLSGAVAHRDTMGNEAQVRPGEVQLMSAGTGVAHSEYNPLPKDVLHLLQIWILPDKAGHKPGYGQKSFADELKEKKWVLAVSGDGRDGSLKMNQDAELWLGRLDAGQQLKKDLNPKRNYWIQITKGDLTIDGEKLSAGDGVALRQSEAAELASSQGAEMIFFNLP
ncbi:MAG: pirin family protein [Bdellovibrionaceae bacterium]|nr:pirin family protein [Pseudobdellovibrionaceae bacterium]